MTNQVIAKVLLKWSHVICQRVRNRWEQNMRPGISGHKEISPGELTIIGDLVTVEIIAQGQACFQLEYGRGSKMAKTTAENPYLKQYFRDMDVWNERRTGYSIRGREEGSYEDLDGITHKSSGKLAGSPDKSWGLNLEQMFDGDDKFKPQYPQYIIQYEVKFALPEIIENIANEYAKATSDLLMTKLSTNLHI